MFSRLFLFLLRAPLFSLASSAAVALASNGQTVFFPIDSSQRGTEIINSFKSLIHAAGTNVPEVALQTNLFNVIPYTTYSYISKGFIPYIQAITPTTYNTLLIVSYLSTRSASIQQHIVLPPEQVSALLYFREQSNVPIPAEPQFISTPIAGTYPYFSVDPKQRAVDIVSAVTQLMSAPFRALSTTQVWIQTTLTGPFNPGVNSNGLLKNVTSISVDNSLIRIHFLPPNYQGTLLSVIVAPEQVQWIIYIRDSNYPY